MTAIVRLPDVAADGQHVSKVGREGRAGIGIDICTSHDPEPSPAGSLATDHLPQRRDPQHVEVDQQSRPLQPPRRRRA